ncbi:uncharacterized protein LOC128915152 isoform X8 [Rissa tridactyla]|nr:uncharacterized protein LOC128915152 isoform X8 [Rissa tridactyla]XP_054071083.1 uncharacterized protein LOC128915152 isoform X8 [Rissa tridactyla]XP_054071084.1 uncharacterized protein LOC128915152 isoform X8 [Rissa tridactyla]XP_054071085.1 uncharacterized protein LOC128915152 isoform X8 [Rissa tridactyla]XP_054071086.1 uncharacterized protein LOC128915152 isoform X8 [Rissa tridactyla]XP_054071087.1 uncharacterized protein LOC128915152 isoform X8 [Rissa tridactyla]
MKGVTSGLAPVPAHPPVPTAFPTALRGGDSSPAPSPAPSHRKQFKASSVACLYPPPTCIMKGVTSGLAPVPAHPPVPTAFPTALRGGDSSPAPSPAPSHRKQFKASSVACLYPPPTCIMKGVTSGLAPVPAHPPVPTAFPTALRGGDSSPAPSPAPSHRKQFKASSVACLYPPPTCIMKGVTSGLAPVPAHPPVPTAFPTALRGGDSSPAPSPAPSHRKQFKASSVAWNHHGQDGTSTALTLISVPLSLQMSSGFVVAGAASTAAFFLWEGLLGQHFDVVPDGVAEPQPRDLFLFPLASGGPGWWGAHAGIYCGDGEIIHLEGSSGTSPSGIVATLGDPNAHPGRASLQPTSPKSLQRCSDGSGDTPRA